MEWMELPFKKQISQLNLSEIQETYIIKQLLEGIYFLQSVNVFSDHVDLKNIFISGEIVKIGLLSSSQISHNKSEWDYNKIRDAIKTVPEIILFGS